MRVLCYFPAMVRQERSLCASRLLFAAAVAVAFSGCETVDSGGGVDGGRSSGAVRGKKMVLVAPDGTTTEIPYRAKVPKAAFVAPAYTWHPESAPDGPVRMEIVLSEQRIYAYRGGVEIGWAKISTGKEGTSTPAGAYKVLQKKREYYSNRYGSFVNSSTGRTVDYNAEAGQAAPSGTHYAPAPMHYFQRLTWDGIGLHEGYLPGYPASHGCIRVHPDMAPRLFEITSVGTPVDIVHHRRGGGAPVAAPVAEEPDSSFFRFLKKKG